MLPKSQGAIGDSALWGTRTPPFSASLQLPAWSGRGSSHEVPALRLRVAASDHKQIPNQYVFFVLVMSCTSSMLHKSKTQVSGCVCVCVHPDSKLRVLERSRNFCHSRGAQAFSCSRRGSAGIFLFPQGKRRGTQHVTGTVSNEATSDMGGKG